MRRVLMVGLLAGACGGGPKPTPGPVPHAIQHYTLAPDATPGLSDLTRDDKGQMWAVSERGHVLVPISPTGAQGAPIPVPGLPADTDLEAVAWVGSDRFALGTETREAGRTQDDVLMTALGLEGAVVGEKRPLWYEPWGLTANDNQGIEGLCAAGGVILAAAETVGTTEDGRRYAPLARQALDGGRWTKFRLFLTSPTGKISALACRLAAGSTTALEVLAVERHFGVGRVLAFRMPIEGEGTGVQPRVLADLATVLDPLPNLEGIVWGVPPSPNAFWLITDTSSTPGVPAQLIRVEAGTAGAIAPATSRTEPQ